MPLPGFDQVFGAGPGSSITVPVSAEARTEAVQFGAFTFSPKASELPPLAWIALAAGGIFAAALLRKRR